MNQKEFLLLQCFWDRKLERSGFNDIEERDGTLKDSNWIKQSAKNPMAFQIKQEYYYQATHFLHDHIFKNKIEKKIWEMHTQGETFPVISQRFNIYYTTVNRIVLKLKKIMLITMKRYE